MKLRSNKGISLTELLATTFITGMTALSLIGVILNTSILNEYNKERTLAVVHAQQIMEEIRNTNFTGLEMAINNGILNITTNQLSTYPYNFTTLPSETINTSVVSGGNPLRIQVSVNWLAKGKAARSYTLESIRTNGS